MRQKSEDVTAGGCLLAESEIALGGVRWRGRGQVEPHLLSPQHNSLFLGCSQAQVALPNWLGRWKGGASTAPPAAGWLECSAVALSSLIGSLRSLKVVIVDTTCGDRLTSR